MKERPILFSGPMVRAILDGRKTQTRRTVRIDNRVLTLRDCGAGKHQRGIPEDAVNVRMCGPYVKCDAPPGSATVSCRVDSPYGGFGDRLWVKEGIRRGPSVEPREYGSCDTAHYLADSAPTTLDSWPWKLQSLPGMFLPRGLSRITLEVTGVRVERLPEITEEEAKAEGADPETHRGFANEQRIIGSNETKGTHPHKLAFAMLWDEINIERASWLSNPWVWVVSFRRVKP